MRSLIFLLSLIVIPTTASAYERVFDQYSFVALVSDKILSNWLYGVRLNVTPNGSIVGGAWGWDIAGNWTWKDGFFCRSMTWGGEPLEYNCQLVEVRGANEIRFTSDQGNGDNASFKLR